MAVCPSPQVKRALHAAPACPPQGHRAAPPVLGVGLCQGAPLAVLDGEVPLQVAALVIVGLEGDVLPCPRHPGSSLGVEGHRGLALALLLPVIAAQRARGHLLGVSRLRGEALVIDGEHPAVELLVVAEVVLGHVLAQEPLVRMAAVGMGEGSPVELPAGIGPQFVEAGIERVGQREGAVGLPGSQPQHLPLHQVAVLVEELHMEHFAQVGGEQTVGTQHIGFVIDGVPQVVTDVVHVDEHLLLGHATAEAREAVGEDGQGVGLPGIGGGGTRLRGHCCDEEQEGAEQESGCAGRLVRCHGRGLDGCAEMPPGLSLRVRGAGRLLQS